MAHELSALPSQRVAADGDGVADGVIGYARVAVLRQLIAPGGVAVGVVGF